jgi:hypothetical protein
MNTHSKHGLSLLVLSLAAAFAAFAPEASAQSTTTGPIRNAAHGFCLTASSSTGLAVAQPCNGSSAQQWTQVNLGSHFIVKNVATGRCLDTYASATQVFTSTCNSYLATQRWNRLNVGTTAALYRSAANGRMLTSDSVMSAYNTFKVVTAPQSGSALQVWLY